MLADKVIGIDYGAKIAGTTAICFKQNDQLLVHQSAKGKDADSFILKWVEKINPAIIFIDAPLSLPAIYQNGIGQNYFYRSCDASLGAMSPMFLGGLTARAMQLKSKLTARGIDVFETYPAAFVKHVLPLNTYYKKELAHFTRTLATTFALPKLPVISSWHQVDALLCWCAANRYLLGTSVVHGDAEEGLIYL